MRARVSTAVADPLPYNLVVSCAGDGGELPVVPDDDDAFEPNNDVNAATRGYCGQEMKSLAALDDDFYVVGVGASGKLSVALSAPDLQAVIVDKDGNQLSSPGATSDAKGLPEGDVYVRVTQPTQGRTYDLFFSCEVQTPSAVGGCTCATASPSDASLAGVAVLTLWGLRRRRQR